MVKSKSQIVALLALMVSVLLTVSAWAKKMDLNTHNVVIDRLEAIVNNLDNDDSSKIPSSLRLGDLYAERSRIKSLSEVEKNCTNCLQSKQDRQKAIKLYSIVIPKLGDKNRGPVMLQKAHLQFALGKIQTAKKIYLKIIKEGHKRHEYTVLGQTHALLGDVYFQLNEFKSARTEYNKALSIKSTPQKGLVHYRLSWCLFNLNHITKGISTLEMILQTPALTQMTSPEGISQDKSFKIDVSKDLATFYARAKVNKRAIKKLQKLSPVSHRRQNLYFLATEADRLGKKKEAALVWVVYLSDSPEGQETLDAQIHLMRLKRDLGNETGSLVTFRHIQNLWKRPGCKNDCDKLQARIRKWIISWNLEKKKELSSRLTTAYTIYTEIFPKDEEMYMRGGNVASERKQYSAAISLYHRAADVANYNLSRTKKAETKRKNDLLQTMTASLLAEIDMAETLKNYSARTVAYKHYLSLKPKGVEEFEIRYQLAQVKYDQKDYVAAAKSFRVLALEKRKDKFSLRKTAADMSIDSLVKSKDDSTIEVWALDYSKVFKKFKREYIITHRKAVLNTTAKRINLKTANSSDLKKLTRVPLLGSTNKERITIYKNRYILALALKDFKQAKAANKKVLYAKGLSQKDHDQAIQNRIWLAELELDFRTAYRLSSKQPGKMTSSRAYNLIWLGQLAGFKVSKHEKNFLSLSKNRTQRAIVIKNKIQKQVHQKRAIKPYLKELSKSPKILSLLALEIYGKSKSRSILEDVYKFRSVRRSSNGPVISRLLNYKDIDMVTKKLSRSKLNSKTNSRLTKTMTERIGLLSDLEKHGQSAIRSKDLILQAVVLGTLKLENERLYGDLLALPVPKKLTKIEQDQYAKLLAQQALPYKKKAEEIQTKLAVLWKDLAWSNELIKNYKQARYEYKPALRTDLDHLNRYAPRGHRSSLASAMKDAPRIPSAKIVSKIQKRIRKKPFETKPVVELKDVENRRGNMIIVSHLESRIQQMKGAKK